MYPLSIEDLDPSPGGMAFWKILPGLAVAMLVACALALIASFLIVTSAGARGRDDGSPRTGHQESAGAVVPAVPQPSAHRP
jgi:hypothetical protein